MLSGYGAVGVSSIFYIGERVAIGRWHVLGLIGLLAGVKQRETVAFAAQQSHVPRETGFGTDAQARAVFCSSGQDVTRCVGG